MAGDWIPMRLDLAEDPAVMSMAEALGVREELIVGYLHKVWSWASRQCHAGSVTNVTLVSLGRVTGLHGFPEVMRDAGWIEEHVDELGRPFILFPKWERWLGESAKKRIQARERQRKSRSNQTVGGGTAPKQRHGNVTNMSRSERDKVVTTGEKRREEKSNTHIHTQAEGFNEEWIRWVRYAESATGKRNEIQEETWLMELCRRGPEKAKRDIEFSISKGARSILDSDDDFAKRGGGQPGRSKMEGII